MDEQQRLCINCGADADVVDVARSGNVEKMYLECQHCGVRSQLQRSARRQRESGRHSHATPIDLIGPSFAVFEFCGTYMRPASLLN